MLVSYTGDIKFVPFAVMTNIFVTEFRETFRKNSIVLLFWENNAYMY